MPKYLDDTGLSHFKAKNDAKYQDKLVSGTNIKTINNQSLLGSGNINISGGGTTKYLHNISAFWSGGSGQDYRSGTISFSFLDTNPNSYDDTSGDMDASDFKSFMADHCGMSGNNYGRYPVSGSVQLGNNELWNVTAIVKYRGSSLWYCAGGGIAKNSSGAITSMYSAQEEISYLETAMQNQSIRMTDVVQ
jgi:hypothetical protein